MPDINFPAPSYVGEFYTQNGRTYQWDGVSWTAYNSLAIGPTGPVGGTGPTGPSVTGPTGVTGPAGAGIATGGTAGQILAKATETDYDTTWIDHVRVSTTEPTFALPGEQWYNPTTGVLKLYSSSNQWETVGVDDGFF